MAETIRNLTLHPYKDVDNTMKNIFSIINEEKNEPYMSYFDGWDAMKIYDYVRAIAYVKDPENSIIAGGDDLELLKSPYITMLTSGDCDCKSIVMGAMFERNNIPYRFAVVSNLPGGEFHHIYPEIPVEGKWLPFDATYPLNDLNHTPSYPFEEKPFTRKKTYTNPISSMALLGSDNGMLSGPGARLAILRGDDMTMGCANNCNGNCSGNCSCNTQQNNNAALRSELSMMLLEINGISPSAMLLGFDPASIIAGVSALFSMFATHHYVDAYHVWEAAVNSLPAGGAAAQATIAVLGVDYMNGPDGANICSDPPANNYCGNRAEWEKIKTAVQARVSQVAPYFDWILKQIDAGHLPHDMSKDMVYNYYRDFKNHGPNYTNWVNQTGGSGIPGSNLTHQNAGLNNLTDAKLAGIPLLYWGLGGAALWMIMRKKGRR